MIKAWRITVRGLMRGIILSDTEEHAKYWTIIECKEAGCVLEYQDVQAVRAEDCDHLTRPLFCTRQLSPNTLYSVQMADEPCRCSKCQMAWLLVEFLQMGEVPHSADIFRRRIWFYADSDYWMEPTENGLILGLDDHQLELSRDMDGFAQLNKILTECEKTLQQ